MGLFPTLLRRPDNILSMPVVGESLPGVRPGFLHGNPERWIPGAYAAGEAAGAEPPLPWVNGQADLLLVPGPKPGAETNTLARILRELPANLPVAMYERDQPIWPNFLLADGTEGAQGEATAEDGLRVFRSALRHLGQGRTEAFLVSPAARCAALLEGNKRAYFQRVRGNDLLNRRHLVTSWEYQLAQTQVASSAGMPQESVDVSPLPAASRVLVIMPHFDDEVLQCGGAILQALAAGAEVEVLWLTDGRRGVSTVSEEESARLRHAEATEAMARLGVRRFAFLDAPETRLSARGTWTEALRQRMLDFQPDRIHTVWFGDNNLDHFEANRVLMAALPSSLGHILIAASGLWQPLPAWNALARLTPEQAAAKEHALQAHASQLGEVDYLRAGRGLGAFYAQDVGQAEAFWCLSAMDYFRAFRATGMPRRWFL